MPYLFFCQRKLKENSLSHTKIMQLLYKPCLALQASANQHGFFEFSGFTLTSTAWQADPVFWWWLEWDISSCLFLGKLKVGSWAFEKLYVCGERFFFFFSNSKSSGLFFSSFLIRNRRKISWPSELSLGLNKLHGKQKKKALMWNFLNWEWRTVNGMQAKEHDN